MFRFTIILSFHQVLTDKLRVGEGEGEEESEVRVSHKFLYIKMSGVGKRMCHIQIEVEKICVRVLQGHDF